MRETLTGKTFFARIEDCLVAVNAPCGGFILKITAENLPYIATLFPAGAVSGARPSTVTHLMIVPRTARPVLQAILVLQTGPELVQIPLMQTIPALLTGRTVQISLTRTDVPYLQRLGKAISDRLIKKLRAELYTTDDRVINGRLVTRGGKLIAEGESKWLKNLFRLINAA